MPVDGDELFDPDWNLLLQEGYGHLYHTRIAPGVKAHRTRESLRYALRLLESGDSSRYARAGDVIREVLKVQDVEPTSPTFGLWPWYAEEPLPQMAMPDYNWAEFCGVEIADFLIRFPDHLPEELLTDARDALHRACLCIFRRNVGPGYTNISLLGGVAMAAAGEVLEDKYWLDYGRQRLADLLALTRRFEGFSEFNSPTYTMVVVEGCEKVLQLVRDPGCIETANALLRIAWDQIAESFHAPTGQWAGAQSRSYHDLLPADAAQALADRTGVELRGENGSAVVPRPNPELAPCPPEFTHCFTAVPAEPRTVRRRVSRAAKLLDGVDQITSIWMDQHRTLGSAAVLMTGHQSRLVHGFWLVGDAVARCRLRVLKDGKDFAAGFLWSTQSDRNVLAALSFCNDMGAWNGWADVPADGVHPFEDLRLRMEVVGPNATAQADDERFTLRCGEQRIVVCPAECRFADKAVAWEAGQAEDHAWVDAVLHTGSRLDFNPDQQPETIAALGCSLVDATEPTPDDAPRITDQTDDRREWSWDSVDLSLTTKRGAFAMKKIW